MSADLIPLVVLIVVSVAILLPMSIMIWLNVIDQIRSRWRDR